MGRTAMLGLIDSLERTIRGLDLAPAKTLWSTYATHLNYSQAAQAQKRQLVAQMIESASPGPQSVWDLGANTGEYSRIAADTGARVMAFDGDHAVVEAHFRTASKHGDGLVLPLLQNLANPSPAMGWAHAERRSLVERGPADLCLALALVHHLAIGGNVPLARIAELFGGIARRLIIEFVPKEDSQVARMLSLREDVFPEYTEQAFVHAFGEVFTIVRSARVSETVRTLFYMERR
jgi:ribosomal protein L11 methylase PrmA